jgi:AcrR family transcriptional regulator
MRRGKALPRRKAQAKARLGREAWITAARAELIAGGISRVRVEPLATRLGVTTGSFYWHFKDRQALLNALLEDWEAFNSAALFRAVRGADDPNEQLNAIANVWLSETDYDPAYDSAVRDWARTSPEVEKAVRRVDDKRIELLKGIFVGAGYADQKAFIRARITYFHQVGYYAMRIIETKKQRDSLKDLYLSALMGK